MYHASLRPSLMVKLGQPALELAIYRGCAHEFPLLDLPLGREEQEGLGLVAPQAAVIAD